MAKQTVNIGTELDDENADSIRDSFDMCNDNFDDLYVVTENNKTDSYTLVLSDANKLVTITKADATTLTVPPNSSVAFPVGTMILVAQLGAGQVTITAGDGVTINSYDSALKLVGQYASCSLTKLATDTWLCVGNLES